MVSVKYFKALTLVTALLAVFMTIPAKADEPIVNRRDLIGQLTPITGDTATASLKITFALGSAQLTPNATKQLDELGNALIDSDLRDLDVAIYGHTDSSGGADTNMTLSKKKGRIGI